MLDSYMEIEFHQKLRLQVVWVLVYTTTYVEN